MTSVAIAENGLGRAAGRSFAPQVAIILTPLRKRFDEPACSIKFSYGKPLTLAQWRVLAAIHLREGATQREISETFDIGTVATGQTINRLEEAE